MFYIPKIREKLIQSQLLKEQKFYEEYPIEQIEKYQIQEFNKLWKDIIKHVQYYKKLVEEKKLPQSFESFDQFKDIPIISRQKISSNIELFINSSKKPDEWGTTGGSTGNPLQFPKWHSERQITEPSIWYLRSFYNIKRSDKMFRLWGHSHTMGKGISRIKNKVVFGIGLPLVGYKRFSAYDLSEEKLRTAGDQIIKFKPKYIIGYSKALYMLAKVNEDRKKHFHKLNLKAVLGAAEAYDRDEDREFVSEIFGCPAGLQYATMEANYIAQTHPDGDYKTLWKNNLIECIDDEGNPSNSGRIVITTLYPKALPLVRYELGDIIENCKKNNNSVYSFESIKGRNNDFLVIDGTPIHSEGITHAVKFSEKILAYQIRYTKDKVYTLYIKSNQKLDDRDIKEIRKRLKQVDKRLSNISIIQVDQLKQTIAGKTKWLMAE